MVRKLNYATKYCIGNIGPTKINVSDQRMNSTDASELGLGLGFGLGLWSDASSVRIMGRSAALVDRRSDAVFRRTLNWVRIKAATINRL